jgi:LysM repeat protein
MSKRGANILCLVSAFYAVIGAAQSHKSLTTKQYIDSFSAIAMEEMRVNGVPASITLGQGILESASGNSKLSKECNNHFGIKCRKNWNGKFCLADDDAKDECFRGYETSFESYRDHSLFLKSSSRYASLFELNPTDYEGWANGLRNAGYATNPAYGNILIKIIQKYRLSLYDSMVVLGEDFFTTGEAKRLEVNGIPAIAARQGDDVQSVATENKLKAWQIYKYNDLEKSEMINPGEILYLKPKRKTSPENIHIVKRGETMHDVSQIYAIKMKSLYKMNQLKAGQEPQIGEEIFLNTKRQEPPKVLSKGQKGVVPMSTASQIMNPARNISDANMHEVQPGETIEAIADKYKVSVLNIVRWNDLEFAEVGVGQILVMSPNVKASASVTSVSESSTRLTPKTHLVTRGQTAYSIARLYGLDPTLVVQWNGLSKRLLKVDDLVYLYDRSKDGAVVADEKPEIHFVKLGETLFSISKKYSLSVDELKRINRLNNNSIVIGQKIKLK